MIIFHFVNIYTMRSFETWQLRNAICSPVKYIHNPNGLQTKRDEYRENTHTHNSKPAIYRKRNEMENAKLCDAMWIDWIEARFNFAHISNSILSVTPSHPRSRTHEYMNWHKNLFDILSASIYRTLRAHKKYRTNFILPKHTQRRK